MTRQIKNAPDFCRHGAKEKTDSSRHYNPQSSHFNDNLTEITSRLTGVIKRSNGGILAFCPSHDDQKGRSLAVSVGRENQVLMHCFAGCSIHEITQAIGLNPADLFPRTESKYDPQTRSFFNEWQVSKVSHAFTKQITEAKILRQKEQLQKHAAAAIKARSIWNLSKPISQQSDHAYLVNKRIQPHGARLYKDALVIPIYDQADELVNLQFIAKDGSKKFLSGGRKRGCSHIIGNLSERILIAEGFATGASLFEESGQLVVVAFDAGNLLPVARNIRDLSPETEIIICGDNDLSGLGQAKAREAAMAINGKLLIPPTPGTDWNDVIGVNHT